MYEDHFSQNNRDALSNLMYSHVDAAINVTSLADKDAKDVLSAWNRLCSDPELVARDEQLFDSAEHWLNYQGIETRTEYGNLLPTYNLFLKIGEWLERRIVGENDE